MRELNKRGLELGRVLDEEKTSPDQLQRILCWETRHVCWRGYAEQLSFANHPGLSAELPLRDHWECAGETRIAIASRASSMAVSTRRKVSQWNSCAMSRSYWCKSADGSY